MLENLKYPCIIYNIFNLFIGGIIAGKSTCENLCFSGASFTTGKGPVTNYHDPTRSAGGSSSGSAVLVRELLMSLSYHIC